MPVNLRVTAGTVADCIQAAALLDGIPLDVASAEYLLADPGYDTNRVPAAARERGMTLVIPPKRNRKAAREYDAALYQARHLVANSFGKMKEWRGVATRYAKKAASYLAICRIRALAIWARLICQHALMPVDTYGEYRFTLPAGD